MTKPMLITVLSPNRIGLVSALTVSLAELGITLVEASQMVVGGDVDLILSVQMPNEIDPKVVQSHVRDRCRAFDVKLFMREPTPNVAHEQDAIPVRLSMAGDDHPGIIRHLSSCFARDRIDIRELFAYGDDDGTAHLEMELAVPADREGTLDRLRNELQEWAASLGASLELEAAETFRRARRPVSGDHSSTVT